VVPRGSEHTLKVATASMPGRHFCKRMDSLVPVDDVLNVAGHRIGTMEVGSALVDHPAVVRKLKEMQEEKEG